MGVPTGQVGWVLLLDRLVGCSYWTGCTRLRTHETVLELVCRLLLEKTNWTGWVGVDTDQAVWLILLDRLDDGSYWRG